MRYEITFSPQVPAGLDAAPDLTLSTAGDVVTINGTDYDLSGITEGATLPADALDCPELAPASAIERTGGVLRLTLLRPVPGGLLEPQYATVDITSDGPVTLPAIEEPVQ